MTTIKAQALYDLREVTEFCSGTDLHIFFESQTGDPSPSGKVNIAADEAAMFVITAADAVIHNNGGGETAAVMRQAKQVAGLWLVACLS